jgi:polysaccharide export outer membrane protein
MVRFFWAIGLASALLGMTPLAGLDSAHAQTAAESVALPANSLLPGDVIRVEIWREEDLSGEFQVDEQGSVVLPLLGKKQVLGISPDNLRDQLSEEYAQYLVNSAVNVTLLRRIIVLGEVRVAGQYTVDATNSVADVIARAQGVTPAGNAEDIVLVRNGQRLRTGITGMESLQEAGIRSGDQIIVGRRSWASRNFSSMVGIISILANVAVIVAR